jgi:hypothetical protein
MNLLDRASKYIHGITVLKDWIGDGGFSVDQHTAQSRTNKCLLCPMNKPGLKLADAVSGEIKKQMELKRDIQLRVIGEKALFTCEACLCPLPLKVWTPIQNIWLDPEEYEHYWSDCWLVAESKEYHKCQSLS